ncbi:hypothetical protein RR48_03827 [Papilio machaon]|uniref:N-acetyltransferase domain-containing protein n=1 Tax=Papilio machaon TaxID=76193 RepID=A0A0N1I7C7_PAPMA|nr:hypothetical protein RR48_03827 [Papilio machaon]
MSCEIIIRKARKEDAVQRAELIQMGLLSHQWDAFLYFLFQEVVGTLSVSEYREGGGLALGEDAGWLHALAVHAQYVPRAAQRTAHTAVLSARCCRWRRRGVGRALAGAARRAAAERGLRALEALTSDLQRAARAMLHAQGWQCRGTYDRRLVGAALTLQLARLGLDLPHA